MILVTGCTGYIGSRLCKSLLDEGYNVRGLVQKEEILKAKENVDRGMEIWQGDLTDPESLKGIGKNVTVVYHLAGLHSTIERMENLFLNGTNNLVNELDIKKTKSFIVASSGAVYRGDSEQLMDEDDVNIQAHPFGIMTAKYEQLVVNMQYSLNLNTIMLRIAEVYGDGDFNIINKLKQGNLHLLGDGHNYMSVIYIDDLIQILMLAQDKLECNEVYNVVDDKPIIQREFYNEVARLANENVPAWVSSEGLPDRIRLSIHGLRMLSIRMSNEKLKQRLNYKFKYQSYIEGLNKLNKCKG